MLSFSPSVARLRELGGVALLIEPRHESRSILFVDNLPDEQAEGAVWIKDIITTVSAVAVKGLDSRNPVVGLKITLTGMDIHPVDSRTCTFRHSTERTMLEAFKSVGLVEWRSAGETECSA